MYLSAMYNYLKIQAFVLQFPFVLGILCLQTSEIFTGFPGKELHLFIYLFMQMLLYYKAVFAHLYIYFFPKKALFES